MKVIYKAPGCAPEPQDIPNTLEELQATVGGYMDLSVMNGYREGVKKIERSRTRECTAPAEGRDREPRLHGLRA